MLTATAIALLVVMAMAVARALLGPTIYDRILAVNLFGTKTVLFIAVTGFLFGRPDFLDIALVYALINFISIIAVLRYFEYRAEGSEGRAEGSEYRAEGPEYPAQDSREHNG